MIASLSACLALAVQAAPASPKVVQASQAYVLRSARMVDVKAGTIVERPQIVVRDQRIVSVGTVGDDAPAGAEVVDLGEWTILPGLIDCHTHLGYTLSGDFVHRSVHEGAADSALRGAKHARMTLLAGFTTVRDVGSGDFVDVSLMRAVERGDIDGPWVIPSGHAIGITGGHADETGFRPGILEMDPAHGVADGADECVRAVREQIKYGAKSIKVMATAGVLSFEDSVGAQQLSDVELRAIVEEANRHGVKVAAHAHGPEGILAAVLAGVASIEHGSTLTDEIVDAMIERGTYLVPTAYLRHRIDRNTLPEKLRRKAEEIFPAAEASLRKAIDRGVKIAFGTDAAVLPHGENAHEFAVYVKAGMNPADALRTATVNAADLLGVSDRGVIAPGMLADLIAVAGNPLEDVRTLEHVRWVMHGGRVVR
ncbi:MAG: amidohydrolase family protein [Planctomycetota bacterium]